MKRFTKCKTVSVVLALAMLLTSLPICSLGADATEIDTPPANYGSVIGNTAQFNIQACQSFPICDKPSEVAYDAEAPAYGDGENGVYRICYDAAKERTDFTDDLVLVITDYYRNPKTSGLWYKVNAAPGHTLPEILKQYPWVFQNHTDHYANPNRAANTPDSLMISDSGKNYILDENGNEISSVTLSDGTDSQRLLAVSTLQGAVAYQWQISASGAWIDIYGADQAELNVTAKLVDTVLDENLCAKVRVVSKSASKTVVGDAVTVTAASDAAQESDSVSAIRAFRTVAAEGASPLSDETENDTVNVTVRFQYGSNHDIVAADKIYHIQKGADLSAAIDLPVIAGYDAYLEDDTGKPYTVYHLNLTNVTEDITVTFNYWPAKVNYTVIYYWQNVKDDAYTEHYRYTATDFTGNIAAIEDIPYEGFYQLLYESVPIASDSSTVVEVYYDRLYYKMLFDADGGYGVQPIYARYGTQIDAPTPQKAGYSFVGWDDVTSGDGDGIADTIPDTLPAHDSKYKAVWKAAQNAKVTVVYWGENANDEDYSYVRSQEIFVASGTSLSFGTDRLICALEEHLHGGEDCTYRCQTPEHTHTEACYTLSCTQEVHTHGDSCYNCGYESHTHQKACYGDVVGNEATAAIGAPENPQNGTVARRRWSADGKVIYINGTWYQYTGDVQIGGTAPALCGKTENSHIHTDACIGCGKTEHTHSDVAGACYTLTCGMTAHTHSADCYSCVQHTHTDDCYLKASNMDTALWTFVRSDTVTVAPDGSTVMNVYYDRNEYTLTYRYHYANRAYGSAESITAKWGANISGAYQLIAENAGSTFWSATSDGKGPYTNYFGVMPSHNKTYYNRGANGSDGTMRYYGQDLDGNYTVKLFSVPGVGGYIVTDEDRYAFEGYTYSHGTENGKSCAGAAFYYNRNSYILDFHNGESVVDTRSVLYEAPLSGLDFTPAVPSFYEPGSVMFAGWYQNPECTGQRYDLSAHTMPASNLILYAKWVPATHTVTFYTDLADVGSASVYRQYTGVPHGSVLQDPYIPPEDPTKGQYVFVGWFYIDAKGNEQMWDFNNTAVTCDAEVYAKWSSNTLMPYEVRFVYMDGEAEIEIAQRISGSALGGTAKTFEAKGNDQLYAGYREGYFPTVASHTITIDLDDTAKNRYTFYYVKTEAVPYTVYYLDASTGENVVGTDGVEVQPVIHADNRKAIVTETYKRVPGYLPDTYQQTLILDPNGENKIVFYYTADAENGMYVVHYWTENTDGTYAAYSVFEGRGEAASYVNATILTIENFTYDENHPGQRLSGQISTDEVLELHVYYTRNSYPYKVQYLELGTNTALLEPKTGSAKWGETVEERAVIIDGYTVSGDAVKSVEIQKDTQNPTVNVITFYYKRSLTTLTVSKTGASDSDRNQTFLFRVTGDGVNLVVTVHGNADVTVCGLQVGSAYTVTEITDWSWRYELGRITTDLAYESVENGVRVTLSETESKNAVTFDNTRQNPNWLDGNSYCVNRFTGSH